jgi:hypothetical protein
MAGDSSEVKVMCELVVSKQSEILLLSFCHNSLNLQSNFGFK